jgi:hypothetical protein
MKIDEAIKLSLEDETKNVELTKDKSDKILTYIKTSKGSKKKHYVFKSFMLPFSLTDVVEVLASILIIAMIPLAIKYNFLEKTSTPLKENITINNPNTESDFTEELNYEIAFRYNHSENTFRYLPDPNAVPSETYHSNEFYTSTDDITQKAPFTVYFPNNIPNDFQLSSPPMNSTYLNINKNVAIDGSVKKSYYVALIYSQQQSKATVQINQCKRDPSHIPGSKKIDLDGIEAWIRTESTDPNTSGHITLYYAIAGKNFWVNGSHITEPTLIEFIKTFNLGLKNDEHTYNNSASIDFNIIKDKLSFEIKYPKYIPEGYSLKGHELKEYTNKLRTVQQLDTWYINENGYGLSILTINDRSKPTNILEKSEKVNIDGMDAWIYTNEEGILQLMFWNNGKYYNICAGKLSKDELIPIAASLLLD